MGEKITVGPRRPASVWMQCPGQDWGVFRFTACTLFFFYNIQLKYTVVYKNCSSVFQNGVIITSRCIVRCQGPALK